MIVDLTGLEVANASLLDEATAAAEAMTMARRVTQLQTNVFFIDCDCHPQTIAVVRTRAEPLGWNVIVGDPKDLDPAVVFGALFQYPGSSGSIVDYGELIKRLHAHNAVAIMAADPLALALLVPPGSSARTLRSVRCSGLVCRWDLAVRTRRTLRLKWFISGRCPVA